MAKVNARRVNARLLASKREVSSAAGERGVSIARKVPTRLQKKLAKIRRREHDPIQHKVHEQYGLSRKTIFYMKEYGPKAHVASTIIRESWKVLLIAAIVSSIGGLGLQSIGERIVALLPLLVLVPAMNNMTGSFGTIIASKFTTALYMGHLPSKDWHRSRELHRLFHLMLGIAIIAALYIGLASYAIAMLRGFAFDAAIFLKIIEVAVLSTVIVVTVIFLISVIGGYAIFRRNEDPNNFLIPITTAVADLLSMLIFTGMVVVFFG